MGRQIPPEADTVIPLDSLRARIREMNQALGIRTDWQTGEEQLLRARQQEMEDSLGIPTPEPALSVIDPRYTTQAQRDSLERAPNTPFEELTGESYYGSPLQPDDDDGFLMRAGKAFLESFYFWEGDIPTRERLFRIANTASLALPYAWAARWPAMMKVFPALQRVTQTRKGVIALSAASEAAVGGTLEAIRGPDPETGDSHVASAVVLGGLLGGALGALGSGATRVARQNASRAFLSKLDDVDHLTRTNSPLLMDQYAILKAGHKGFNAQTRAKMTLDLQGVLEGQGYITRPVKFSTADDVADAILVPGLDERTAIQLVEETGATSLVTNRGMIDISKGHVYPAKRSLMGFGQAVDPDLDAHMVLKLDGGDLLYRPGFDTQNPVRLENPVAAGRAVDRLDAIIDDSSSRSWPSRLWHGFQDLDMGATLHNFYRKTVRQVAGMERLERMLGVADDLPPSQLPSKMAELMKSRFGTWTEQAMYYGVPSWNPVIAGKGGQITARNVHRGLFEGWSEFLQPGEMDDFVRYGFARRIKAIADELGEEAIPKLQGAPVMSGAEAARLVDNAPANFAKAFDHTVSFQNAVMDETLVKSGILTREQFLRITRKVLPEDDLEQAATRPLRDFIPLSKAEEVADLIDDPGSTDFFAMFDPVKRLATTGQENAKYVPWTEEIVRRTSMYARMADQQRLIDQIVDLTESAVEHSQRTLSFDEAADRALREMAGNVDDVDLHRLARMVQGEEAEVLDELAREMDLDLDELAAFDASRGPKPPMDGPVGPPEGYEEFATRAQELQHLQRQVIDRAEEIKRRPRGAVERTPEGQLTDLGREAMASLGLEKVDGPPPQLMADGARVLETLSDTDAGMAHALQGLADQAETIDEIAAALHAPAVRLKDKTFVRRLVDGSPEWYRVTDEGIWDTIQSLGPVELGMFEPVVQSMSAPASFLRTTVTQSFEFLVKNPVRDLSFAWVNAGLNPLAAARGLASLVNKDDFYHAWRNAGGPRSALVSLDRPAVRNLIREVTEGSVGAGGRLKNVVKSPRHLYESLRAFSEGMENMTRLGAFRSEFGKLAKNLPRGMTLEDAALEAALRSKQVSVNFSMTGSHQAVSALRGISAFWNAGVQGLDQIRRSALDNPRAFMGRGAALTGISAGLYLANRQHEEYQRSIPDWEKMLFWHVKMPPNLSGPMAQMSDEWVRIPKPFEPGILFGSMPEFFLQALDQDDPRVLDDAFGTALGDIGVTALPMPTVFSPVAENLMNRDLLTGAPVVPRQLEDVDPDYHIGGRTSGLAIGMARFLNEGAEGVDDKISPLQLDNFLQGVSGGLGEFVYSDVPEALADAYRVIAEGRSVAPRRALQSGPRRTPAVRGFLSTFPYSDQSVDDLYRIGEEARVAARTATYLEETFQVDDMVEYINQRATELQLEDQIQRYMDQITELRETRDKILMSNATIQEKRQATRAITIQMGDLARPLVEVIERQGIRP